MECSNIRGWGMGKVHAIYNFLGKKCYGELMVDVLLHIFFSY